MVIYLFDNFYSSITMGLKKYLTALVNTTKLCEFKCADRSNVIPHKPETSDFTCHEH